MKLLVLTSEVRCEKDLLLANKVPEELLDTERKPGKLVNRLAETQPKRLGRGPLEIFRNVPFFIVLKMCDHHMLGLDGFYQFVDTIADEIYKSVSRYVTAFNPDQLFCWTRDILTLPVAMENLDSQVFIWNQAYLMKKSLEGDQVRLDDDTDLGEICYGNRSFQGRKLTFQPAKSPPLYRSLQHCTALLTS